MTPNHLEARERDARVRAAVRAERARERARREGLAAPRRAAHAGATAVRGAFVTRSGGAEREASRG